MADLVKLPKLPKLPTLFKLPSLGDKPDLDTSDGLYKTAKRAGLQKEADDIVRLHGGEEHKKIFSGGFISDVFDVLNVASFGVVGVLKGKGFVEGIKNRESFSDQDSLGQFGLMGVVGGIILDIATDPFTYIAPWTILRKVPGFTKAVKVGKKAVLGEPIKKGIIGTDKSFQARSGGFKATKWLADKIVWQNGADPVFKETYERSIRNIGVEAQNVITMVKQIGKVNTLTAQRIFRRGAAITEGGGSRLERVPIEDLQRTLSQEDFDLIKPIWDKIDANQLELERLGILGKGKSEENIGIYLKNAYTEYETFKKRKSFFSKAKGIVSTKARKENLTAEMMKDLGQIEDPAYLLSKTMLDQTKSIENGKLFRDVNKFFASDIAQDGFTQISADKRFQTSLGKVAELRQEVGEVNKNLAPLFKGLKQTFKADARVLSEIDNLEKELLNLTVRRADELTKFFSAGHLPPTVTNSPRKLGIIPEKLQPLANEMKKFNDFDSMDASAVGIKLEKLYVNGDLERAGFRNRKEFFETVKSPFTPAKEGMSQALIQEEKAFEALYGFSEASDLVRPVSKVARETKDITPKVGEVADVLKPDKLGLQKQNLLPSKVTPSKKTLNELTLLVKQIQDFNRGFKKGAKATAKQIGDSQDNIIEIINQNFKVKDRGKFLKRVRSATTPAKLDKLVTKLADDFKTLAEREADSLGLSNLSTARVIQKRIEGIISKSEDLKGLDKRGIDDSFRSIEKQVNDLQFFKEDLLDDIGINQMGDLAGKYVPDKMAEYLSEAVDSSVGFGHRIVSEFKYMKVVLSPAANLRNLMSNKILNWWKLGIGPWRLDLDVAAIKSIRSKDELFQRAQKAGLNASTYAANELNQILVGPHLQGTANTFGRKWRQVKEFMGNVYQQEEAFSKLIAFKEFVKKGFKDDDAWKMAESATFNYAQVTPFIRKMRTAIWGVPFITFPLKATPVAIEAAFTKTARVSFFGKFRNAMENLSDIKETEEEKKNIPPYIREGFFVKLPIKDQFGRSSYFDLTYIIPFGDLISGQLFERPIGRKTGLKESIPFAIASKNPALNLIKELMTNQNFSGQRIWLPSDSLAKQTADMVNHLNRTMAPPWVADQLPGGYNEKGVRLPTGFLKAAGASAKDTKKTLMQELSKNLGLKVQPVGADIQDGINEWNTKKGLQTLLKDKDVVRDFSSVYIPKTK